MQTKQQKQKVGVSGSLINQLMGNNSTLPEVGKGATQLHYTDRTCYEVIEVSEDKTWAKLQRLEAKADPSKNNEMGHQNWVFEPTNNFVEVVWRRNSWQFRTKVIKLETHLLDAYVASSYSSEFFNKNLKPLCNESGRYDKVVAGKTKEVYQYEKVSLLFGVKNYYYDWSF